MVSKWGCVGWLKKRTSLEKTLLSLSSLLLLTLVIVILVSAISHGKTSEDGVEEGCMVSECIQTAGEILSSMDPDIDYCADFYGFSCGRYSLQQSLAADRKATDALFFALKTILESSERTDIAGLEDLRRFYGTCVQFGSYRPNGKSLLSLMKEMGLRVWPILDPTYEESEYDRPSTLASLALLGVPVVFRMEVVQDSLMPDSYLLKISPGGPREVGRSPDDIRSDDRLHSGVLTSLLLLGITSASVDTDVKDILYADSTFAAIDNETLCDGVDVLAPSEVIGELQRLIPEVEWLSVFSRIRNATGLHYKFAVELHCKRKIRHYANHLEDFPPRIETNYLGWRFFSEFLEHVIPTFEKSSFGAMEEDVPQWRSCLKLMQKFATPLLAEVYTRKRISGEVQREVERIVQLVVSSTQKLVSRARWLSEPQRKDIQQKVARLPVKYPFLQDGLGKRITDSIPQVDLNNFTAVVIRLQRQWIVKALKRLNLESGTESWVPLLSEGDADPSDYLPVYLDKVVPPYLRFQGPDWINFGGFGVSFAREISKLLITITTESDESVWDRWTRNQDACLLSSFASRLAFHSEPPAPAWMESKMKELFLDLSSLEIAYESAQSSTTQASRSNSLLGLDLNQEKMLFLAHAQTLCDVSIPFDASLHVKDRLNTVVSSFGAFNEVFSCESSSSCSIWQ